MKATINDIDLKAVYDGYIWMSDEQKPKVLNKEPIPEGLINKKNPFIIEAELFDEDNGVSYSVRNIDGKPAVSKYEMAYEKMVGTLSKMEFVTHRIKNHSRLIFHQLWKKESDELCEGMETLVPAERFFIGFENNNEEEE